MGTQSNFWNGFEKRACETKEAGLAKSIGYGFGRVKGVLAKPFAAVSSAARNMSSAAGNVGKDMRIGATTAAAVNTGRSPVVAKAIADRKVRMDTSRAARATVAAKQPIQNTTTAATGAANTGAPWFKKRHAFGAGLAVAGTGMLLHDQNGQQNTVPAQGQTQGY